MYLLYSALFAGALVLGAPFLLYRSLRERGFARSLVERFGLTSLQGCTSSIWIHAVSVGEVIAAATLVPVLRAGFPGEKIVVSVITVTGRLVAADKLRDADHVFYCPFDLAFLVRRAVSKVRPRALIIMETEIWPHLLREAKRAGAVTMIAGGRISDRSFPRYRAIARFMKRYLEQVDSFCMQNALYAKRVEDLGAATDRIRVTGSLKFDGISIASGADRVFPEGRRVLIGGSTLAPEEEILLSLLEPLRREAPDLFLVIAPRHPRRFDEVVELARRRNLRVVRRSSAEPVAEDADVMILDTLGELASLYAEADYVFVGGSLADWGGHNIIEPALHGKPVLFGPHMRNFPDIARIFLDADAAMQVRDETELERALRNLIAEPERASAMGKRAMRVIEDNRGASKRTVAVLEELLS